MSLNLSTCHLIYLHVTYLIVTDRNAGMYQVSDLPQGFISFILCGLHVFLALPHSLINYLHHVTNLRNFQFLIKNNKNYKSNKLILSFLEMIFTKSKLSIFKAEYFGHFSQCIINKLNFEHCNLSQYYGTIMGKVAALKT